MHTRKFNRLPDLVDAAARDYGDATALVHADAPESGLSYAGLRDCMQRGAACLQHLQPGAGQPVLLFMDSRPEWIAAFFSILAAGKAVLPVPPDTAVQNAAAMAAYAGAEVAILGGRTEAAAAGLGGMQTVLPEMLFQHPGSGGEVREHDVAVLAFTSGGPRQPRAVELTHANLLANLGDLLSLRQAGGEDAFLSILPPAHMFELMVGHLGPLASGARIVYAGAPLPNRLLESVRTSNITHALAVPSLVDCLYKEALSQLSDAGIIAPERSRQTVVETARRLESELPPEAVDGIRAAFRTKIGSTFHTLAVGGAALEPAYAGMLNAMGIRLELGYGLTEAAPIVSMGYARDCPAGSVGRPLESLQIQIAARGEILVKGPSIMKGYFKDPQATRDALRDGWLQTGDRGRLDAAGFLFVEGRIKEAMVTGSGETIYPEDIEPWYEDSIFAEVCVTALPGPDGNDLPTLFAVPADEAVTGAQLEDVFKGLKASAPDRLKAHQCIRLDRPLPRTATGKVRRRLVAAAYQERKTT